MISYMPLMRTLDKKGLTLTEVETGLGLAKTTFSNVIRRNGYLRTGSLLKIAEYLNCGVEDLICWTSETVDVKYVSVKWDGVMTLCKKREISAATLSESIGHNWNFVSKLKSRDGKVSPVDLEKIADVLKVKKEELMK